MSYRRASQRDVRYGSGPCRGPLRDSASLSRRGWLRSRLSSGGRRYRGGAAGLSGGRWSILRRHWGRCEA